MSVGISTDFLAGVFGPSTTAPVYLASLKNAEAPANEPGERHVITRKT
jgi:hypothetical protein